MFLQSKLKRQRFVSALTAALAASVLVACGNGGGSSSNTAPVYTAVFDAGSSGTRLEFYKVVPGNGGYPVISFLTKFQDKLRDVGNDDGINDFLNNQGVVIFSANDTISAECQSALNGSVPVVDPITGDKTYKNLGTGVVSPCVLGPQLTKLEQEIASLNAQNPTLNLTKAQVRVELFATAGMRTEELYNGGTHSALTIANYYAGMKQYVANQGYNAGEFKTINGNSEEGLWAWINMNDQYFNAFGGNNKYWTGLPTTRGDIEVGGSSMQVAFPTTQIPVGDANNVYAVTINGRSYNVFSKTFLGLGGDDARKFMRSYDYSTGSGYNQGRDCFGQNASASNTAESSGIRLFNAVFFPSSTTPAGNAVDNTWNPLLAYDQPPMTWSATTSDNFNATNCTGKYQTITDAVIQLPRNNYGTLPYGSDPVTYDNFASKLAQSSQPIVGMVGFYFTAKFLGLTSATNELSKFTPQEFETAYASKCSSTYAPASTSKLLVQANCAAASNMKQFLWGNTRANGGLFAADATSNFAGVVSGDDLAGKEVLTWTRGYLLKKYAN